MKPLVDRPLYRIVLWIARRVGFPLLGGLRAAGKENVPAEGPVILAPNHVSYLDPPAVAVASPRRVHFMAEAGLFRNRLFGGFIARLAAFPVQRGTADTSAIRKAIEVLKAGGTLMVFPEGTRGDGAALGEIGPGLAMLVNRTGAAVVPVGVVGTHLMWPKGGKLRRGRVRVRFGQPIRLEGGAGPDARERFADELGRRIAALCAEEGLDLRIGERRKGSPGPSSAETAT
jgi:1-acyl-sn-glycerol-3-phosphate acyltransferase